MRLLRLVGYYIGMAAGFAALGCGAISARGGASTNSGLSGEITTLRNAPAGSYADVEAINLVDREVASSVATNNGRYSMHVAPGPHLIAARTAGKNGASTGLVTSGTVEVGAQAQSLNFPPLLISPWGALGAFRPLTQNGGGGVLGIG